MDEYFPSGQNATLYTPAHATRPLSQYDQLAIQVVADHVAGPTPQLTLSIEHSTDGLSWVTRSATPEINNVTLSTSSFTVLTASDAGTKPRLALTRFKLVLTGAGAPASGRVRLYVTAR